MVKSSQPDFTAALHRMTFRVMGPGRSSQEITWQYATTDKHLLTMLIPFPCVMCIINGLIICVVDHHEVCGFILEKAGGQSGAA